MATASPATEILDDLRGSGAVVQLNSEVLDELLEDVNYRSGARRNAFLTHLYQNRKAGNKEYEVDHIFPRGNWVTKSSCVRWGWNRNVLTGSKTTETTSLTSNS